MKRYLLAILTLCAFVINTEAKPIRGNIKVTNISVEHTDDILNVSFNANIAHKIAKRSNTIIYAPVITNGQDRVSLPEIIVQDKRAKTIWERHEWADNSQISYDNGIYTKSGETVKYNAGVPFQKWMEGAHIYLNMIVVGCCDSYDNQFTMAENILSNEKQATALQQTDKASMNTPELEQELEVAKLTVAETMAETFPFILPASEYTKAAPIRFYDDERDNSLTVYFRKNSSTIDIDYAGNKQTLVNLLSAINIIRNSNDSDVEYVVVGGFASPEGPLEVNDRLALERAMAVRRYVIKHSDMTDKEIKVFNGQTSWDGVRKLIEKDDNVPDKQHVLYIIDNIPIWDSKTQTGRTTVLRNLNGGVPYRYIDNNIFPKLRNGAFIRVYFNNN